MKRTKVVCTLGPASSSRETIAAMIEAGMDVARLNFSHGEREDHGSALELVRSVAADLGRNVAVLQDLAGPKTRIGPIREGQVVLRAGHRFVLTARDVPGDEHEASLTYTDLPKDVAAGDRLLLADGTIELRAEDVTDRDIATRVVVGGPLSSHKGINLPDRSIGAPILSEKDRLDLAFGLEAGVDYVALSFVRTADDVREARELIDHHEGTAKLIAKIEKHEAVDNIDAIIELVDGVMVARGDLGVEIPVEDVPTVQKRVIEKANRAGKSVITATQMLTSMVTSPQPTRAEVSDVANAILDGTDAVMLSEETAVGSHPAAAVAVLSKVAAAQERVFPYTAWTRRMAEGSDMSPDEAVAHSACRIAEEIDAAAIITFTKSGSTTRLVAKYRPEQPILAMTPDETTVRRLALVWGAVPILTGRADDAGDIEQEALDLALESGLVKPGDRVLITAGLPVYVPGTTNLIKIASAEGRTS
jgi:pyruvate kinase